MGSRNTKSATRPVATAQAVSPRDYTLVPNFKPSQPLQYAARKILYDTPDELYDGTRNLLKKMDKSGVLFNENNPYLNAILPLPTTQAPGLPRTNYNDSNYMTYTETFQNNALNDYSSRLHKRIAQSIMNNPLPNQTIFSRMYPELVDPTRKTVLKKNSNPFISPEQYQDAVSKINQFMNKVHIDINQHQNATLEEKIQIAKNFARLPANTQVQYIRYKQLLPALQDLQYHPQTLQFNIISRTKLNSLKRDFDILYTYPNASKLQDASLVHSGHITQIQQIAKDARKLVKQGIKKDALKPFTSEDNILQSRIIPTLLMNVSNAIKHIQSERNTSLTTKYSDTFNSKTSIKNLEKYTPTRQNYDDVTRDIRDMQETIASYKS